MKRLLPWIVAVVVAMLAFAFLPIWPNPMDPSQKSTGLTSVIAFGLANFRSIGAACVGWLFCRLVLRTNLSEVGVNRFRHFDGHPPSVVRVDADGVPRDAADQSPVGQLIDWKARGVAAIAQALVIGAFVVTVGQL